MFAIPVLVNLALLVMNDFILVSTAGKSYRIKKDDIIRVESCNDHPVIFMSCGKQHVYSHHLKVLEAHLDSNYFFRVHKSFLVNLKYIENVDWRDRLITMIDNGKVPISSRKKSELRRILTS